MGRHRDNYNTKQMKDVVSGKRPRASLVEGTSGDPIIDN
jgi:hypothetical protein